MLRRLSTSPSVRVSKRESQSPLPIRVWRAKWLYLALLIPVAMLLIFEWLPAFSALYNSLYIWNGGKVHFYVGLEHYERMLSDRTFRVAITNLVGFVFFRVIMQTVLPFFAAEMIINLAQRALVLLVEDHLRLPDGGADHPQLLDLALHLQPAGRFAQRGLEADRA